MPGPTNPETTCKKWRDPRSDDQGVSDRQTVSSVPGLGADEKPPVRPVPPPLEGLELEKLEPRESSTWCGEPVEKRFSQQSGSSTWCGKPLVERRFSQLTPSGVKPMESEGPELGSGSSTWCGNLVERRLAN